LAGSRPVLLYNGKSTSEDSFFAFGVIAKGYEGVNFFYSFEEEVYKAAKATK